MNTERLVSLVRGLVGEVPGTSNAVQELVGHVQNAINQPSETTQRQAEKTLQQLRNTLRAAQSNELSPGVLADLATLTVDGVSVVQLVGSGLEHELDETFQAGYLSVGTLDRLKRTGARLKKLTTAVQQVTEGVTVLGLSDETLPPGTSVVSMGIPHATVDGLFAFEDEIHFFAFLMRDLTEVTTGEHEDSELYSLHSSIFGIDVLAGLEVAANFAKVILAIKTILDLMKGFRGLKKQAEELAVDPAVVEQLTAQGTQQVEERLDALTVEIFQDTKLTADGRVNELRTAVRLRLNGVVNRIEKGFTFDVRTTLPTNPDTAQKTAVSQIESFRALRFEPVTTPLILLPEPTAETEKTEATIKPDKTRPKKAKSKREN